MSFLRNSFKNSSRNSSVNSSRSIFGNSSERCRNSSSRCSTERPPRSFSLGYFRGGSNNSYRFFRKLMQAVWADFSASSFNKWFFRVFYNDSQTKNLQMNHLESLRRIILRKQELLLRFRKKFLNNSSSISFSFLKWKKSFLQELFQLCGISSSRNYCIIPPEFPLRMYVLKFSPRTVTWITSEIPSKISFRTSQFYEYLQGIILKILHRLFWTIPLRIPSRISTYIVLRIVVL